MAMEKLIRFRVFKKDRSRAKAVVRALGRGKQDPATLSDYARDAFFVWLNAEETRLGLNKEAAPR